MAHNDKLEREAALIAEAERIERLRNLEFALRAIWGDMKDNKQWRKKHPLITAMVERVLKEGE